MPKKMLWKVGVYSCLSERFIRDGRDSAKRVVSDTDTPKSSPIESRQGVPHSSAQEEGGRLVSVGHGLWMRGCNTTNPATRAVAGFDVGHFGGAERLFEIVVKEAQNAGKEVLAVGEAGYAVLLAGIDLHIKIHSCVNQSLDV